MFDSFPNNPPNKQVFQGPHGCLRSKHRNSFSVIKFCVPALTPSDLGASLHPWTLSLSVTPFLPLPRPHTAHRWFQRWGWGTCESVRAWIFSKYASSGIILSVKFHWNACNPPFFNLTSYVWWGCKTVTNILGKIIFFFLLSGNGIEVAISLTISSSEFLPLPFWTLSALYFAVLHSILCWLSPDQKLHPILWFTAIQFSAAMTVNVTLDLLMHI